MAVGDLWKLQGTLWKNEDEERKIPAHGFYGHMFDFAQPPAICIFWSIVN